MYRTARHLVLGLAIAALTAVTALAQSLEDREQSPNSQRASVGSSPSTGIKEDFDRDPVTGWEFRRQHAFVPAGRGRALATKGAALWVAAGEVSDFTMKFRYGYERGIALVDFRHAHRYGIPDRYTLLLSPTGVHVIRVQHLPDEVQERELASAPFSLPAQTWHDVIIQAVGDQINVLIDGKGVISVRDPQPLRSGMCALSVESGVVLYDQVTLIPQGKADQGDLASDPANWTLWSAASAAGRVGSPSSPSNESPNRLTTLEKTSPAVP